MIKETRNEQKKFCTPPQNVMLSARNLTFSAVLQLRILALVVGWDSNQFEILLNVLQNDEEINKKCFLRPPQKFFEVCNISRF